MIFNSQIELSTKGYCDILNITGQVEKAVDKSGIADGLVTIFVPGSTGSVTTIEFEDGVIQDLTEAIERIAPSNQPYHHDARWGDGNGFSHVRAALMKPGITVPIIDSQMTLGTWQQIVFIDFDNKARSREIVVQIQGE
jgi:secondary thiamine-phosphate synthase enzyme